MNLPCCDEALASELCNCVQEPRADLVEQPRLESIRASVFTSQRSIVHIPLPHLRGLSAPITPNPLPLSSNKTAKMSKQAQDLSQPYLPKSGLASDGRSSKDEASATCFCGSVQLAFPLSEPGLVGTFLCHCTDCRKITASMFASNFIVLDSHLKHVRGQDLLTRFGQSESIETGNTMTNSFCSKCGTLMYRVSSGYPGKSILRIGTVDDFNLHETILKPRVEQYTKDRVNWLSGARGVEQRQNAFY